MNSFSSQTALCSNRQAYTAVGTVSTVRQDLLKKPSSFPGQFSDKYSVVDEMIHKLAWCADMHVEVTILPNARDYCWLILWLDSIGRRQRRRTDRGSGLIRPVDRSIDQGFRASVLGFLLT